MANPEHLDILKQGVRLVGFERLRDWECFDGDAEKDSARGIREYFIPDFSNWKAHDSYRQHFSGWSKT